MSATETAYTKLSFHTQTLLAFVCGMTYFYAFQLNAYWFDWFEFSHGTNWVYIPSGLRLLFVLVLARVGVIGIALSSIAVNYTYGNADAHFFNLITGLLSGLSPYVARYLAITWLNLDTHLSNLNARIFLKISILFAIVNAVSHQLWYFWVGQTQSFVSSTFAMAVGDWFGTVLVLASASLLIKIYKLQQHKSL